MNVPYPDIPQAGLFSRLPALFGMAARGDRHIPEIKMRVEPEKRIRNIRVEARHEFCDLEIFQDAFTAQAQKLRDEDGLFPAVDTLSHVEREKSALLCRMQTDFLFVFIQVCSKRRKVRNRG